MAGAPKGNRNAVKIGKSALFRIRFADPGDIPTVKLFSPEQLGTAVIGYMMWLESPESDEVGFLEWIKEQIDHGQYD